MCIMVHLHHTQFMTLLSRYFQMFLDSLCSPDGKFPEHLEEEVLRPALVARFRVARLQSRLISSSPSVQLENLSKSLENYKYGSIFVCLWRYFQTLSGLQIKRLAFDQTTVLPTCCQLLHCLSV